MAWREVRRQRILDFDIENRPLTYAGGDFTFSEVTAIAWKFIGEPGPVKCGLLTLEGPGSMLPDFLADYEEADVVTGHNIIRHDLPIINGMALENGLGPIRRTYVSDTYRHLMKRAGVSGSQESLAAMLGIAAPKVSMNQIKWREANRLTEPGLVLTMKRVTGDVRQHIQLRQKLLELGWLKLPQAWQA
jgi:hypothetical protein